jgi:nucleoside-diphosphate-sugar epimerase
MMRVLVTGATGFIGSNLVETLVAKGYEVKCLVRRPSRHLEELGVELVKGDITLRDTLKGIAKDVDVVCHLAAILGRYGIPDNVYWKVNVEGTKLLMEECLKESLRNFIYCSTAGVVGPLKNPTLLANEKSPYNPSDIYELTKAEAEKLVLKYHNTYSLPVTVLRPAFVYGPRDMHLLELFKAIQEGSFVHIAGGRSIIHPTYVGDVIQAFELCLGRKGSGEIFIVAGERPVTWRDFVQIAAGALQVPPPSLSIPRWLAISLAFIMEGSAKLFSFHPPLTISRVRYLTENRAYDISKIKKELGYRPIKLEEGIKKTIEWYIQNGYLRPKRYIKSPHPKWHQ